MLIGDETRQTRRMWRHVTVICEMLLASTTTTAMILVGSYNL